MEIEQTMLNGSVAGRSDYNPDERVRARTAEVLRDFWYARQTMNNPYLDFNNKSVISELTDDQHSFNAWVPPKSDDPDEEWRSDAYDPIVRNKVISISAHLTRALVFPQWEAVNSEDKEDRDAAMVMSHLVEWAADQSNYVENFLYAVIDALVTPAAIVHHEYAQVYRTIKDPLPEPDPETGKKWKEVTIVDEELSGFQDTLIGVDELFIADAYIRNIQLEPYLIWRRVIQYDTAYAKYHGNKVFDDYVREGVQLLFDQQTLVFYRQYDENLRGRMVEEVIYWNRKKDLRLVFVNGAMLTDPDQPNPRKDKKYPFVKGGYSPFRRNFFWYSSLVKTLSNNERQINDLYRMIMDGTAIQLIKPVAVQGEETIDSSVPIPGNIINLHSDTKITPMDFGNNLSAGFEAYKLIRANMGEASVADRTPDNVVDQTAFQVSQEEQEAMIMLGMFAKMISFMVRDWATLFAGDVLQHLTVGQVDEILGSGNDGTNNDPTEAPTLKFRTLILPSKGARGGRRVSFDSELGEKTKDMPHNKKGEVLDFNRLTEEGGPKAKDKIISVDPALWRQLKFKCRINAHDLLPPSDAVSRALNIEEFDRMIQSPSIDQDEALFILLGSYPATKENPDKYISKNKPVDATPTNSNGIMPQNLQSQFGAQAGRKPTSAQGAMSRIMGASMAQRKPFMKVA